MAFNFFNNTIANNLSKTNKQINNAGNINSPKNDNPNMPIDGLINQANSKNNNAIGIGGEGNQVMGETPWWNWQFGEGEGGQMGGGNIYNPNTLPPDYGGGNTGSEWTSESLAQWNQLVQDMIATGYIENSYTYDWDSLQEQFQNLVNQGNSPESVYNDMFSMFSSEMAPVEQTIEEEQTTLADDLAYSPRSKKSAKKLYYGGTGGESSRGFLGQGTI